MAVLPIGSMEQHGPHLPLCTDSIIAQSVAEAIARELNAFLLPCIPISSSIEHKDFAGSVWIMPQTLASIIRDIVLSLKYQGIKKIVVVNGHGGNFILKPAIRELNLLHKDLLVILVDLGGISPNNPDIHAGEAETSLLLYLRPELVKGKGVDYIPKAPRSYIDYFGIKGLSRCGVWGLPSKASPEKGKQIFETLVRKSLEYIKDVLKTYEERKEKHEDRN